MVDNEKVCLYCGKKYIPNKYNFNRQMFCSNKCQQRDYYIRNAKVRKQYAIEWVRTHPEHRKTDGYIKSRRKYRDRLIKFKDKFVDVGFNPRSKICSLYDIILHPKPYVTNMHHYKYDEDNPLAYTFELCSNCHLNVVHANGYDKLTLEELIEVLKNG